MRTVKVNISSFASSMGFCQQRIINEFHMGMKQALSKKMQAGKALHWKLEEQDLLIPRKEATQEQLMDPGIDLDFAREKIQVCIQRDNVNRFVYTGLTDKVVRIGGDIYIYDDKTVSDEGKIYERPFLDKTLQMCAYCEGFLNNYANMIKFNKIFFKLIFRNAEGKILYDYKKEYRGEFRDMLLKNFELFESVFNKAKKPEEQNNPNKCRSCGFLGCEKRMSS
jgi:hypothetical protein